MIKGPHDFRSLTEVLSDLLSTRTSAGDEVDLNVEYSGGDNRPTAVFYFRTFDQEKKHLPESEEITSFLPESHSWPRKFADGTIDASRPNGFPSWKDYVRGPSGLAGSIRKICDARRVRFTLTDGVR